MRPKGMAGCFMGLTGGFAVLLYGLPRLPRLEPGWSGAFATAWIGLSLIVVGSFLHQLMGADRQRRRPERVPLAVRRAAVREISRLSRHRDYV
ncbi:MAG: hypothetical protein QJR06_08560 [Alicyclobacillaceae bacterium]|nr:hypothetical protein [Alicyclobacillaceae bacterium]